MTRHHLKLAASAAAASAVGHANGMSTVIQGLGKLPITFKDPVISRWVADGAAPLNGA